MRKEFIVTNEYLTEKGLDLNEYALEGTLVNAIIQRGLTLLVNRMCQIGDEFHTEKEIEMYLSHDDLVRTSDEKVSAFYEAQYQVLYNLIFQNETNPVDQYVDGILVYQLGCKINGFQKGLYYKNN